MIVTLTDREASALADMTAALRPEWQARVTRAYLTTKHRNRTYGDLIVALAAVCADETSRSPAVIELDWPWAVAASARRRGETVPRVGPEPGASRCTRRGHEFEEAARCRLCPAEDRAFEEPTWGETKPIHAVGRSADREALCGLIRQPGLWLTLGTDRRLVLEKTTCPGCRTRLQALIGEEDRATQHA